MKYFHIGRIHLISVMNLFFLLMAPHNAIAFRGDPCGYSDCSGGYGSSFLTTIFGLLILIWAVYSFFKNSEFRKNTFHVFAFIAVVIVFPASFVKEDKDLAIILLIAMFFIHKWIYSFINKEGNDLLEKPTPINDVVKKEEKSSNAGFREKNNPNATINQTINSSTRDNYIKGLIGSKIQKEIKGFDDKDALLWKECLVETKGEYQSADLLYRVARTKFLIKLNESLFLKDIVLDDLYKNMKYDFCGKQSDARKLAYSS